jgi:hypothetical protein
MSFSQITILDQDRDWLWTLYLSLNISKKQIFYETKDSPMPKLICVL